MVTLMTLADRVVVEDSTLSINTTGARAGVQAPGVDTGKVGRAVIAEQTLRLASQQRITLVVSDTLAHSLATLDSALSIGATGVGVAWILGSGWRSDHWLLTAPGEGVSNGAWWTAAYGVVLSDLTQSSHSTGSRTGVNTLLGNTSQTGGTVRILEAFSLASLRRDWITLVASPAGTNDLASSVLTALSVGSTG
jgi:hypothetical protein